MSTHPPSKPSEAERTNDAIATVRAALESLDYGAIVITVHAGRIVQLDVTRKQRFGS